MIEGYKKIMELIIDRERMLEVKRKEQERIQEFLKQKKEKEKE